MIVENIDKFNSRLENTKRRIEEEKFKFENIKIDTKIEIKPESLKDYSVSPIKFDSNQKSKQRSEYFNNLQKFQIYASIFKIENFSNFQMKIFQKLLLGERIIINSCSKTGKSLVCLLYTKFLIKQNSGKNIIYITVKQKLIKIQKIIESLKLSLDCFDLVLDSKLENCSKKEYDVIIIDGCVKSLHKLTLIKQLLTNKKTQLISASNSNHHELTKLSTFFNIPVKNILNKSNFSHFGPQSKIFTFSYEDDSIKSVTKFVKLKVVEEKTIKFNFNKPKTINFCLVSSSKEVKESLMDSFQNNNIKATFNASNSEGCDCFIVDSIYDIKIEARNIILLDFNYNFTDLFYLNSQFRTAIHVFLPKNTFLIKRKTILSNFSNIFVFQEILNKLAQKKSQSVLSFQIDFYERKFSLSNYEKFLEYLMTYKYLSVENVKELKRINIFYIKNVDEFKKSIKEHKVMKIFANLTERRNHVIVEKNKFKEVEPVLSKLKKEAVINFSVYQVKDYILKTNRRNVKKMKNNFIQIISGYNSLQEMELRRLDRLYIELRKIGFGCFTRSKKTSSNKLGEITKKLE